MLKTPCAPAARNAAAEALTSIVVNPVSLWSASNVSPPRPRTLPARPVCCQRRRAQAASYYAFFDLGSAGDITGAGKGSVAYGINSSNQVVGRCFPAAGSDAAIWNLGGGVYTRTTIPSLDGTGTEGIGDAINDYGTVAGQSSAGGAYNQAFAWTPTAVNGTTGLSVNVGTRMPGVTAASRLVGVNDAGQAVGYGNGGSGSGAYYWDGTSLSATAIPLPAGASSAFNLGAGINSSGLVAGTVSATSGYQAVTWRPGDASVTNLNASINAALAPTSTCVSSALAVNDSNQVVGYYNKATAVADYAYLYNNSGNIVDLGGFGGIAGGNMPGTMATAINDEGCVVGTSLTPGVSGTQHAFLWTPTANNGTTGSMVDLSSRLVNPAAVPAGYYLDMATGINSAENICGYMYDGTSYRAFALLAALPGDANLDGRVDINDLTVVLSNFGQTSLTNAWASGDFNGDGRVDVNDLTILLSNFGQSRSSSADGTAAVPEPASMAMLAALSLAAVWTAARRRN